MPRMKDHLSTSSKFGTTDKEDTVQISSAAALQPANENTSHTTVQLTHTAEIVQVRYN